jgi:GDSL-like lipase/acylhydrolase family protein
MVTEKTSGRMSSIFKIIAINLALILFGLVLAELTFGNWFMPYAPPDPKVFDRKFVGWQDLYEPHGTITYTRDRYGLRGVHDNPISMVDIVTVGGSTTDQVFITEGQTWQDVIHAETGLVVANAGIDGMALSTHIAVVEDWLHRIPGLHPRYYLHFLGVNDAWRPSRPLILTGTDSWNRWLRPRSAIYLALRRIQDRFAPPLLVSHGGMTPEKTPVWMRVELDQKKISEFIEASFKPTLRTLIKVHQVKNETVILVTQPANPLAVRREGEIVFVSSPQISEWAATLWAINRTMSQVCHAEAVSCHFIDMADELHFEPEDFYDLVHYTPKGASRIGKFLSSRLESISARGHE